MAAKPQVHLIDGTYELFRMYFGAPSTLDEGGVEVGATRAWLRSLSSLLLTEEVTHVAVAFDTVIESFRNALFDGYKTGAGIEPALLAQFPLIEAATAALGVVVWPMVELEADDALAGGAHKYAEDVDRVVICSPDKDLCQCVRGEQVVLWDRRRDLILDEAAVVAKLGVRPASVPDYLALVGDTADGIPGILRWGAKSAAAVLQHYGRLEAIPDNAAQWAIKVRGASSLADNLARLREAALLYRRLATLRTDVIPEQSLDELRWRGPDRDLLFAMAQRLDAPDVLSKLQLLEIP